MAGADYYSCDKCGRKTFYDVVVCDQYESRVGQMIVICPDCVKTHEVVLHKRTEKSRKEYAKAHNATDTGEGE